MLKQCLKQDQQMLRASHSKNLFYLIYYSIQTRKDCETQSEVYRPLIRTNVLYILIGVACQTLCWFNTQAHRYKTVWLALQILDPFPCQGSHHWI